MTNLRPHEAATRLRPLKPREWAGLLASVREQGVLYHIWVLGDEIVDGVHRWRAAQETGRECPLKPLPEGADPFKWARDLNVERRQMSETDKALYADAKSAASKQGPSKSGNNHFSEQSAMDMGDEKPAETEKPKSIDEASEEEGVDPSTTKRVRKVRLAVEAGDAVPELKEGMGGDYGWTVNDAVSVLKETLELQGEAISRFKAKKAKTLKNAVNDIKKERKRAEAKAAAERAPRSERVELVHCDVADLGSRVEAGSVDLVVCDPPYFKKDVGLYGKVARFAEHALRDGGSLLLMDGGGYTDEVHRLLRETDLGFHGTFAYVIPGPQKKLHHFKTIMVYKPVIWMVKGQYDPQFDSPHLRNLIDGSLKEGELTNEFHDWGQSEVGAERLLYQFLKEDRAYPRAVVCDPMVGGGAFGVAALYHGASRFIGADIDEDTLLTTRGRLAKQVAESE